MEPIDDPRINEPCRHCRRPGPHTVTIRTAGVHYANLDCAHCGKRICLLGKPDGDSTKRKRPAAHVDLAAKHGRGFCEMCHRKHDALPKGQTLEGHHVVEFQDGGSNERDNVWIVCTACHQMIHWLRDYHGGDHLTFAKSVAENLTLWKDEP